MRERAAVITALILDRPTCLDCIVQRTETDLDAIASVLSATQRALELHSDPRERCAACGQLQVVFWFTRPPS